MKSLISILFLFFAAVWASPVNFGAELENALEGRTTYATGRPPFQFTSIYNIVATPGQVVNGTTPTGGIKGAMGYYNIGINSKLNYICWNIKITGYKGQYEGASAANTVNHLHEAARGQSGPPRIVFKNPRLQPDGSRTTYGCKQGPWITGVIDEETGKDTGIGFRLSQIEKNPKGFFCDIHSTAAIPGVVRGQLA